MSGITRQESKPGSSSRVTFPALNDPVKHAASAAALRARLIARPEILTNPDAIRVIRPMKHAERKELAKLDPLPQLRVYQEKNQPKARVLSTAGSTASVKKRAPEQTPESRGVTAAGPSSRNLYKKRKAAGKLRDAKDFADKIHDDPLIGLTDPLELVQKIKDQIGFRYMTAAVPHCSIDYHPYNLQVVVHENINPNDYYTISATGVTRLRDNETEYTTLGSWEKEYRDYQILIKIKTFSNFRMWKAFAVWRKNVRTKKISQCKNDLSENLFIVNDSLRPALISVRDMCYRIGDMNLCRFDKDHTYHLKQFQDAQMSQLNEVTDRLAEFRELVKEVVRRACANALFEAGFPLEESGSGFGSPDPDDEFQRDGTSVLMLNQFEMQMYVEQQEKATYTEQASKRAHCRRLTSFIRLADYLIVHTMHTLAVNSVSMLLSYLVTHSKCNFIPDAMKPHLNEQQEEQQLPPLFVTELLMEINGLYFTPNANHYLMGTEEIIRRIQDSTLSVKNLVTDDYFHSFTKPKINDKFEEHAVGEGPSLAAIFEDDKHLQTLINNTNETIEKAFELAWKYAESFEPFRQYYRDNENLDVEAVGKGEHVTESDVKFFAESLAEYKRQHEETTKIVENMSVGMLLCDASKLKTKMLPSPQKCLEAINDRLPKLARQKNDALIETTQGATSKLDVIPSSTIEFVESLTFLDEIQEKTQEIEEEANVIRALYDLIEKYNVPAPPEDVAVYQTLTPSVNNMLQAIDRSLADRDANIEKFCTHLDKDIASLSKKVKEVKLKAQGAAILDPNSDMDEVLESLEELHTIMNELQEKATEYKSYQKQFKVDVTRFDELEETHAEVRMKQQLWESLKSWDVVTGEWFDKKFEELNPEDITQKVQKYAKSVFQMERGLPPNGVVPLLKEKVDGMKNKVPVITNLRNLSLKARHWEEIETTLSCKFDPSQDTLATLEQLNAFQFAEELEEISGKASSEANLETMLRKVEEDWKLTEFTAIPHGKDVYILGGLDEIMALLDDSVVNISTIAGSRHVGPIKPRVEDWQKQLALFADTLDEWQTCQRNWLYLESIFSAPDIQRQLPNEAKMFLQVDKTWKEIMRKVQRIPNAMRAATQPGLLETFQNNNSLLDQINKCLEDYLESKRLIFPRFYFLSNDELLQILAQTRNPQAVQPHLSKCFDAIKALEFGTVQDTRPSSGDRAKTPSQVQHSNDIIAMLSPDGERVALGKGLKARGNVENWLGMVEENMMVTLRRLLKASIQDFEVSDKNDWVVSHASQIILAVSQIMWCKDCTECLTTGTDKVTNMKGALQRSIDNLTNLAAVVRQEIPKLIRNILGAKITIDVHLRDICSDLVKKQVESVNEFEWLKQLRYYWDTELDNCVIRMSNSYYIYGYEYLGASMRLVITPLTDKCYLCLMGALQLDLGGAPAGPAGTGKTETTKDLSKALAKQCVVFNCSESLDYRMMGKFFSGLSSTGAWCCFDEFNRIDIEVLSVIAQQLLTIRNAKAQKLPKFMFEGRELKLNPSCAAFITMNPGYAGRTELPDNLKALFRPFAMMVPDYTLIAEVILYSEGFEDSLTLAHKMTRMYALCSEQLSQQDHYDFGMRAVKSVLVMAGSLKRENPDKREDVVLLRALRDSNLPKFLHDDTILFQAILQDLFPGLEIPEHDYGVFSTTIEACTVAKNLQVKDCVTTKVIQFFETMQVRHGVMLVGPTGGGKTACYEILADTLTKLHEDGYGKKVADYRPVRTKVLNPKAVTMGELYGEFNLLTMEWKDGLLATAVREAVKDTTDDHKWIINDGPVDALWIENMNTVLDDNKMLCLANSERIKLNNTIHMVFEVQDLAVASPATVSRCGMVYIDESELGWRPMFGTWISNENFKWKQETKEYVSNLFNTYVDPCLKYVSKNLVEAMPQVPVSKVQTVALLFESLVFSSGGPDLQSDPLRLHCLLATIFAWCLTWGVGGNLEEQCNDKFDSFVKDLLSDCPDVKFANPQLSNAGDVYSCYVDMGRKMMESWDKITPNFKYEPEIPYFDLMVPTIDTTRFGYLMEKMLALNRPVLFTGPTGVGKSVIAKQRLYDLGAKGYIPAFVNFSAQTNSFRTQEIIENKLEKKRKNILGAPKDKRIIILVDDLNMPKLEQYGAQPPIELLRQLQDFRGFYDRDKLFWKEVQDVTLSAACAPPGGGRNPVTPRFVRHFSMFAIPSAADFTLKTIFTAICKGFLAEFPPTVKEMAGAIVSAAVEIYCRMSTDLLPTPAKAHYIFNLRDLSKLVQGVLQADVGYIREPIAMFRLFCHESLRVFHDRLIDNTDKKYFCDILSQMASKHFNQDYAAETFEKKPIIFGDFMKMGAEPKDRLYEDIKDNTKLIKVLNDYLDDYNMSCPKEMKLVFFLDAIQHVSRIARMVRQPRGNALLVGVGGTGKQSLTRLACHMAGYTCIQIELTRGYNYDSFHEDLKLLYQSAGVEGKNTVFLFTDTQIVVEEFLEDINNILNSGEISNLFPPEEFEAVINAVRPKAKEAGVSESDRDGIYDHFIGRVRDNLHIVLCMSPVGDAFRSRCRMFPSIVNCCTIDWFTQWPKEALLSVSNEFFADIDIGVTDEVKEALSVFCEVIHTSVSNMSDRFFAELRRNVYTTPTSYLELINLYLSMLNDKRKQLCASRDRVANGLKKLLETNDLVASMEVELTALGPELKKKSEDTDILMVKLEKDQIEADKVRAVVSEEEAIAKEKAEETEAIAEDAQRDLDEALPLLHAANKALDSLDKSDIAEVRVFANPPEMVMTVMEAVCILLGSKTDWASAKGLLGDTQFLSRLVNYDKDNIPDKLLRNLKKYIDNPKFVPEIVEKTSKACKSLCLWVRAIDSYAHVFRTVEPKREKLAVAQQELAVVTSELAKKQAALQEVEDKIKELQDSFDASVREKESLQKNIALTAARLKRAGKLVTALGDEQVRWDETVKVFQKEIDNVAGNVFIASACVAYYGPFTAQYREMLVTEWIGKCQELGIPVSEDFSLVTTLADPFEIRQWNLEGLPRDAVSTENAVLVTKGRRWPLMIDPQDQANRWIIGKERKNGLKIVKLTDKNLLRTLENAIRIGLPVLIEEVGEALDPALEPILLKQTFMQGGRLLIRLGDSDVDYDKNFRFYMTSKLSNPHYMPEIFIKVTIINFTVTRLGLEDQLLADVTRLERPDLEEQRNALIMKINADKQKLKDIEDKILKMLFHSEGNILDDEELIETLNDSKVMSKEINIRLKEAEETEEKISKARAKYIPVATRGSVIYFVTADLSVIDPMYQYSLKYFTSLFVKVIETSEKSSDLEKRLQILLDGITLTMYNNIGRGLFERHKVCFSFMLCVEIMKQAGIVTPEEWNFFIRGLPPLEKERPKKPPQCTFLDDATWNLLVDVEEAMPTYAGITNDIKLTPVHVNVGSYVLKLNPNCFTGYVANVPEPPEDLSTEELQPGAPKGHWDKRLNGFQRLTLVKYFEPEALIECLSTFVVENLGEAFVENPPTNLPALYKDMSQTVPLIFVLSSGSDPMAAFLRFAKEKDYEERVHSISLGQGQGPVAEKLISAAQTSGDWVFLQNCHLAKSWMLSMEEIIKEFSSPDAEIHEDFRLFLSSMPAPFFPVSVLQNGIKVTSEPPKGLRSNLRRAFGELNKSDFEDHILKTDWCKIVFGICFFHAVVLERRKFGPLAFNIPYEFADSDRECAIDNFKLFTADGIMPWDALQFITAEITYGGRVTDEWDQRCLKVVLNRFFRPATLEPGYLYSSSDFYHALESTSLDAYKEYIEQLPIIDPPEIFDMSNNANISYQKEEAMTIISTILEVQPRLISGGAGKSSDEIVFEMADLMLNKLPEKLDIDEALPEMFEPDSKGRINSLSTVLSQEVVRFNKLLAVILSSLSNIKKAIKGLAVMSEQLEAIFNAIEINVVPTMWADAAYPSLKPLGSWVKDLELRLQFISRWMEVGQPKSFWMSGFFFPQGFITGALQNFARKYDVPIDALKFRFEVLPHYRSQVDVATAEMADEKYDDDTYSTPDDGVLVHGLYIDAASWDDDNMVLGDARPGVMNPPMPVMHLLPDPEYEVEEDRYECPLYKTSERAGTLSTTGHSTNFVIKCLLPSDKPQKHWIGKGTALLCQLSQ